MNYQIACAKHYIGNEQEHFRTTVGVAFFILKFFLMNEYIQSSSNIGDRVLHEIYGYPFLKSVLAGVGSVMCGYNLVSLF